MSNYVILVVVGIYVCRIEFVHNNKRDSGTCFPAKVQALTLEEFSYHFASEIFRNQITSASNNVLRTFDSSV